MRFERQKEKCLSKCMKLYFFPEKKCVYLPYLKVLDPLLETHLFFYLALFVSGIRQGYRDTEGLFMQ